MTFSIHFLLCNFIISILLGIILLLKYLFKDHITRDSHYYLWYIFICALILPFIPNKSIVPNQFLMRLQYFFQHETSSAISTTVNPFNDIDLSAPLGRSDFASASNGFILNKLDDFLIIIWMIGCLLTVSYFIYNLMKIHFIQKNAYLISQENEPDLYKQYVSCMQELKIKRTVALYASCNVSSPISYGLLHPKVIIPQDMDILLSEKDIRFIFLHELQHYKHKDAVLNNISCILQSIYWFNPFIWYGFRILQRDREIACDNAVIQIIGKGSSVDYGYTLIRYAEKMQHNAFLSPFSRLGGEKKVIIERIKKIANYKTISKRQKINSIGILALACILVFCISPLLTVYASQHPSYNFSSQNVENIDLSSYFDDSKGSFVIYDMLNDSYKIYNRDLSTKRVSPDSTYKIYSGLFALEEGIINYNSSEKQWDGTNYYFDSWNKDQTLTSAMHNSVNWYFQELDSQIGYKTLFSYYNKISYGNCNLSAGIKNYWAESSLRISPVEQVILLSELLENKWNFKEENIQAIKNSLFISDTPLGKLYGKTGSGSISGQNTNGWFIGFIEQGENTYCFATNLQNSEYATGSVASEITIKILNSLFQKN